MGWFRRWRRTQVLRQAELDGELWRTIVGRYPFTSALTRAELARLRELVIEPGKPLREIDDSGQALVFATQRRHEPRVAQYPRVAQFPLDGGSPFDRPAQSRAQTQVFFPVAYF